MTYDALDIRLAKLKCEKSHLFFTRWFFKIRQNMKFIVNWHHVYICEEIEKVFTGETTCLVINVPPGSGKTELAINNLIARGMAINPWARFLHISYADDLALLNSDTAKTIVQSEEFQEMWPTPITSDAKAKKRWNVELNRKKAGGVYAVSLGGQITGFRAGHMAAGFQGAILVDDPLKPEDAYSAPKRKRANRQLLSTVKSRKANPDTPIIVIMQRVHEQDPTGFIKAGNLPGDWRHVVIPALIDDKFVATLPAHIQKMVDSSVRDKDGRFSYWPYKEPLADLLKMEAGSATDSDGNAVSRFVFAGQYQQSPIVLGGDMIKGDMFPRYNKATMPRIAFRTTYGDTAQKTKEANDFSVFLEAGLGADGKLYLIDLRRGKWEAPALRQNAIEFWNAGKARVNMGILRKLKIEDKASGTGLIQDLRNGSGIPVFPIPRNTDKLTRVMDVLPYIESGMVCVPDDAAWVSAFIAECEAFTKDDTHSHDDQIDTLCDAIADNLAKKKKGFFS